MVICYRKKMLRLAQIWFYGSREEFRRSGKEEAAMAKKADIAFYHGIREPESGPFCLKQTFHSRFSDLTLPEETLFSQNANFSTAESCSNGPKSWKAWRKCIAGCTPPKGRRPS